jgi:hypothetical protein
LQEINGDTKLCSQWIRWSGNLQSIISKCMGQTDVLVSKCVYGYRRSGKRTLFMAGERYECEKLEKGLQRGTIRYSFLLLYYYYCYYYYICVKQPEHNLRKITKLLINIMIRKDRIWYQKLLKRAH